MYWKSCWKSFLFLCLLFGSKWSLIWNWSGSTLKYVYGLEYSNLNNLYTYCKLTKSSKIQYGNVHFVVKPISLGWVNVLLLKIYTLVHCTASLGFDPRQKDTKRFPKFLTFQNHNDVKRQKKRSRLFTITQLHTYCTVEH